jgi:hypothetical protein
VELMTAAELLNKITELERLVESVQPQGRREQAKSILLMLRRQLFATD